MSEPVPPPRLARSAAILVVAATYFYFLLFAEFALLELARPFADGTAGTLPALSLLGATGIGGSLAGAAWFRPAHAHRTLAWLFRSAALGAMLAAFAPSRPLFLGACALTGLSLGGLTVVLSASLRAATGLKQLGWYVGLGTGLAYGACNVPAIFQAPAQTQAIAASAVALLAALGVRGLHPVGAPPAPGPDQRGRAAAMWIVILFALVGLDSAAFYVIQHEPALRTGTWTETADLRGNATMHLLAAIAAGWAFDRGWRARLVAAAMLLLVTACALLAGAAAGPLPRLLYTTGVSLYSVVLVAYPALGARPWASARIFAIAGWGGSALGIGLVLQSTRIPMAGIGAAVLLLGAALLVRHRALRHSLALVSGLLVLPRPARADDAILRGREVYIAEGCINCHSQYVRPQVARDVERWGPASAPADASDETPPLLGNRRQGPDLANVGLRRSPAWNQLHLLNPQAVSPGSVMPGYAHLFVDGNSRGPDLVAYLATLGADRAEERAMFIATWRPQASAGSVAADGRALFAQLCSACHGPAGRGDGVLRAQLSPAPPDWAAGPRYRPATGEDELQFLARVIKFGLPLSAMAGHEYLPDRDVLALARHVQTLQSPAAAGPSR